MGKRLLNQIQRSKKKKPIPRGQISLPFAAKTPDTAIAHPEIKTVALPFIKTNRYAIA
ncbi:MAG: hypothetical protein AAGA60_03085 [Cyanobacteria bacterium P01_E01_bin.42]